MKYPKHSLKIGNLPVPFYFRLENRNRQWFMILTDEQENEVDADLFDPRALRMAWNMNDLPLLDTLRQYMQTHLYFLKLLLDEYGNGREGLFYAINFRRNWKDAVDGILDGIQEKAYHTVYRRRHEETASTHPLASSIAAAEEEQRMIAEYLGMNPGK